MQNNFHANKNFGKDLFKNTSINSQPQVQTPVDSINKALELVEERYQKKIITIEEYQQKVKELTKERDKYLNK